jgi:transposase InsO family protein
VRCELSLEFVDTIESSSRISPGSPARCTSIQQQDQESLIRFQGDFILRESILYKRIRGNDQNLRLVIPQGLRETVLRLHHDLTAHNGRNKMMSVMDKRYYWSGMHQNVRDWCKACIGCVSRKPSQPVRQGELQPIQANRPFQIVGIDIVGPLRKSSNGFKYILTCIDFFTNWVEATPLRTINADEVAENVFKLIICRHGCPEKILSDKGTQFTSALFKYFCKKYSISKLQTSAFHPQTNGKIERFHRYLGAALAILVDKNQLNWDELLDCCLFAYRTTIHRIAQETPFFLLYGRDVVLPGDIMMNLPQTTAEDDTNAKTDYKASLIARFRTAYDKLLTKREAEIIKYKANYDKRQHKVELREGDQVMYFRSVPKKGLSQKLLPRWEGPFRVERQLGPVSYRIARDGQTLVAHIQKLRVYKPFPSPEKPATTPVPGGAVGNA